jgi:endonuclease/exonuclease/phosphatase family metal-dependent hydrolase
MMLPHLDRLHVCRKWFDGVRPYSFARRPFCARGAEAVWQRLVVLLLGIGFVLYVSPSGASAEPSAEPVVLRLMSYNVHHGRGADGQVDLDRIARTIVEQRPDLVALQELDRSTERSDRVDQLAELARLTKMHGVFGKSIDLGDGEYGLGVLSRFPIAEHRVWPLPSSPEREQRVALETRISVPGLPSLIFVSTHFDHTRDDRDRVRQAERIVELFGQGPSLAIIAGDLNAPPDSPTLERLQRHWRAADCEGGGGLTAPADEPRTKIDYVLLEKNQPWRVRGATVVPDRVSSDHRPVVVEVEYERR